MGAVIGTVVGAGVAVVAAPLVVAGLGFGAGGIVAGSYAASMMSAAAIANGGAVAAGSSVAILQSIGAAGFGVAGLMGVGAAGAGVGAAVGAGAGVVMAMGNVELIIMDSSGNSHSFTVTLDEPLLGVFTEFRGMRGLAPGTVRFELNGVQLDGGNTLRMINWKIGDVVDAILL